MKIKNIKQIDVQDWDKLVEKTYGKIYSFQQQNGCKSRGVEIISTSEDYSEDFENDSITEVINGEDMGVSFKAWLERNPKTPLKCTQEEAISCNYYWGKTKEDLKEWQEDKSRIRLFWYRNFYPDANMIAKDLVKRGLLEEGDYQIKIDW